MSRRYTMSPRFRLRKDRMAMPIIIEGEESSSGPPSTTRRLGLGNKSRKNEQVQKRPHVMIRVESEDRSDRESQSTHRQSIESPIAIASQCESIDKISQGSNSNDLKDRFVTRSSNNHHEQSSTRRSNTYGDKSITMKDDATEDLLAQEPFTRDRQGFERSSFAEVDSEDQWVAFDSITFGPESQERSSMSFFGTEIYPDPMITLEPTRSDQSIPGLLRNSTNLSSRSLPQKSQRSMDVDELFKTPSMQSISLRSSSLRSPVVSCPSLKKSNHLRVGFEDDGGSEEGYESDDEIHDILGDYLPPTSQAADCSDHDESIAGSECGDQLGSTRAEDGSYNTTDIESEDDEADDNNGTESDVGIEAAESFESASFIDMIGEAVIAIWDEVGPPEPHHRRQRAQAGHQTERTRKPRKPSRAGSGKTK